ncbi:hypothetical protein C8D92_107159 [Tamilnaduibacter salinus]|uniref:Uncharacterized protein n=1 Tax=Tamilnaduibacter salinus TaxID=1484056 RepID=A0A2U1CVD2_9GAMM|nr:hypothetical protein C8D92_107159 [Tamilnaduibacter salinus]
MGITKPIKQHGRKQDVIGQTFRKRPKSVARKIQASHQRTDKNQTEQRRKGIQKDGQTSFSADVSKSAMLPIPPKKENPPAGESTTLLIGLNPALTTLSLK